MPPRETIGIEERHKFKGAGGVVVHRATYEQTGRVLVALGKEIKPRKIPLEADMRHPQEPSAPKLQGQWGLFWETLKPGEDFTQALFRTVGQSDKPGEWTPHRNSTPGEEVGGVSWRHSLTQFHFNTLRFATEDDTIPAGTENTACANFIVWDEAPFVHDLQKGHNYDMSNVSWWNLNDLLNPRVVFRHTVVHWENPRIPASRAFPVDSRVNREALRFARTKLRWQRFGNFGGEDQIDLGCIALRPGTLQTLEDLKSVLPSRDRFLEFYAHPEKFYTPRVHDTLLYVPEPGLYLEQ